MHLDIPSVCRYTRNDSVIYASQENFQIKSKEITTILKRTLKYNFMRNPFLHLFSIVTTIFALSEEP